MIAFPIKQINGLGSKAGTHKTLKEIGTGKIDQRDIFVQDSTQKAFMKISRIPKQESATELLALVNCSIQEKLQNRNN